MTDRHTFYNKFKLHFRKKSITQSFVDGVEGILDACGEYGVRTKQQTAYILATAWHETAHTMKPLREYGRGRKRKYGRMDPVTGKVYYGRGFVQLTWKYNYKKMSGIVGEDLVNNPNIALEPAIAARILVYGMMKGMFNGRGKGLPYYIHEDKADYIQARRTVNILDKARHISKLALKFEACL